jgi:surfeit locus 1 family protein
VKFGSRIFSPRPFTTVLAIALIGLLASLGRWQLRRAAEKQVMYDAFDQRTAVTQVIHLETPPLARYQHVEARGAYDTARQILIDNMTDAHGRAGYFVITPFSLTTGGWLLVNRGWVPVGASRGKLPTVDVPGDVRELRGRADHLPAPGIQLGERAPLRPPFPVVASFPSRAEIGNLLHEAAFTSATDVVLLDSGQPDGYVREWQPPGFPPMRNIAYAVQWFGLALALGVIYIVTNVHRATDGNAAA